MVPEAAMICIDNSEWMRNGDFPPTRMEAQTKAVRFLCAAIIWSNPENTVGLLTMAGKQVRVVITPTKDITELLDILDTGHNSVKSKQNSGGQRTGQGCMKMNSTKYARQTALQIGGEANLKAGIQVAQMALKHRRNKSRPQRIIVFTGSTFEHETKEDLKMIGSNLKKNSVALDVVNFSERHDEKFGKIKALIDAVNSNDNSNIAYVPPCSSLLAELMSGGYPVITRYYTQISLRISLEAKRTREEAAAANRAEDAERGNGIQQCSEANNNMRNDQTDDEGEDEDDLLQKALATSKDGSPKSP